MRLAAGLPFFPDATRLELTGPYEVISRFPDFEGNFPWRAPDPASAVGGHLR